MRRCRSLIVLFQKISMSPWKVLRFESSTPWKIPVYSHTFLWKHMYYVGFNFQGPSMWWLYGYFDELSPVSLCGCFDFKLTVNLHVHVSLSVFLGGRKPHNSYSCLPCDEHRWISQRGSLSFCSIRRKVSKIMISNSHHWESNGQRAIITLTVKV